MSERSKPSSERRKSPVEPENIQVEMCSIDLRLQILSQVPFFAGLTPKEIQDINSRFTEQGFGPGDTIIYAGDPAEHLYVVAAGKVKLLRHTLAGKDLLIDILTTGEFFGSLQALGDAEYPDTATAQTTVCTLVIGANKFRQVLEQYPGVTLRVLEITANRLKSAHEMLRQVSAYSVEHRIAYTLLKLAEKLGEEQETGLLIQAPLTRDDMAEMTGTTTETASRVLSQFQKEGLINSGRQWIAIADLDRLKEMVEE